MPAADDAVALFERQFGAAPQLVVRAPGRVNLIGEHTDYANLPVLPFAIDRALYIAAGATEESRLEAVSASVEPPAAIARAGEPERLHGWHRYLGGVLHQLRDEAPGRGAQFAIAGDLPQEGGLSSSSAMSVGVAMALCAVWGIEREPADIATLAATAERATGVETGGMDQRVIALAHAGTALRIDFQPPAERYVPIPDGFSFVVASSGEPAPKGDAARDAYNERVAGMRMATVLLGEMLGLDHSFPLHLADVAGEITAGLMAEELPATSTAREVARQAHIEEARITNFTATSWNPTRPAIVRGIARHILDEAERVDAAERALFAGDLASLGKLFFESQASLRDLAGCSTPALNALCKAMRRAGAAGARLTGAGFGGFALAVCEPGAVDAVIEAATKTTGGPAFAVDASAGAAVLQ